jgi:hypothetical protein
MVSVFAIVGLLALACEDEEEEEATPTPPVAETPEEVLEQITAALIEKNDWSPDEVEISLGTIIEGKYAQGGVSPVPPGPGGGGWWAVKTDGSWTLLWDGQGAIPCENLEPYPDFPPKMIPECIDEAGRPVQR